MAVYDFILKRRSIRKFKNENIPEKDIRVILEAANHAPASYEYKSWKLILIKDKILKEKIARESANQTWVKDANILIVGVMLSKTNEKWIIADTAIALENMILAAECLGYGSCWVGAFNEKRLKKMLQVPEDKNIFAYIAIGLKDEEPKERAYKKLEEIIYLESYKKI